MPPLYVSFFAGTGYAQEAAGLTKSLDAFGLPHDVRELPDAGQWEMNCSRKAAFIISMRQQHPGRSLVWLDADARVIRPPTLFDELTCDFAAHWKDEIELLSGTMFWGATDQAGELLELWMRDCGKSPTEWDQKVLQRIINSEPSRWTIERLPASYTAIFDAEMSANPVIEHRQASRRLKR